MTQALIISLPEHTNKNCNHSDKLARSCTICRRRTSSYHCMMHQFQIEGSKNSGQALSQHPESSPQHSSQHGHSTSSQSADNITSRSQKPAKTALPLRLLFCKDTTCNLGVPQTLLSRTPERRLLSNASKVNVDMRVKDVGILPDNLLRSRPSVLRFRRSPIFSGIVPVNKFRPKPNTSRLELFINSLGISPLSLLRVS
mmetsp:Transcript_3901/g.5759  ORF Transcript_3901/g.5759 Transcript_3901/m.5759 type:complete len:199 (+) Transcript_3901:101-697(+)